MKVTWDYFCEELSRFRNLFGDQKIMLNKAIRERALQGFCLSAFRCQDSRVPTAFKSTVEEFTRRCALVDMHWRTDG